METVDILLANMLAELASTNPNPAIVRDFLCRLDVQIIQTGKLPVLRDASKHGEAVPPTALYQVSK